jgi:isopenicillin N synthase-like dioxygenase
MLRLINLSQESYEIGSDANPDQPNIWLPPSIAPEFRPFMTRFYWTCFHAASNILRALALGLGLDSEDHLLDLHCGHYNQLRLLHYPTVPAQAIEQGEMARMPAHTDWSSMTMLFQDDCGGLEIEDHSMPGKFLAAKPMEGALVMNVGDLLMRWSNGNIIWPTVPHTCLSPKFEDLVSANPSM